MFAFSWQSSLAAQVIWTGVKREIHLERRSRWMDMSIRWTWTHERVCNPFATHVQHCLTKTKTQPIIIIIIIIIREHGEQLVAGEKAFVTSHTVLLEFPHSSTVSWCQIHLDARWGVFRAEWQRWVTECEQEGWTEHEQKQNTTLGWMHVKYGHW